MFEKLKSYVSWAMGVAVLALYFLLDRKTKEASVLKARLETDSLTKDVQHATEKMEASRTDYAAARAAYDKLRSDLPRSP